MAELRGIIGDGDEVLFAGSKLHMEKKYFMDGDEWWQWIIQSSLIYHDLDMLGFNTYQMLLGFNYGFDPLRLAFNLEGVGTTSRIDSNDRIT